jgi:hypothetical protein
MGLSTRGAIIQPSVSELIGKPEAVVTPNAVSAMSEAFRSGYVTAADVVQRNSERQRTEDKAAIEVNKAQQQKAAQEQQNAALMGVVQKARLQQDYAASKMGASGPLYLATYTAAGLPLPTIEDPLGGGQIPDTTKIISQLSEIQDFNQAKKREVELYAGWEPTKITQNGRLVQSYVNKYTGDIKPEMPLSPVTKTFAEWKAAKPGTVIPAVTGAVQPNVQSPAAASVTTGIVQPRAASGDPVGQRTPEGFLVLNTEAGGEVKAPTEVQQRGLNAIARFQEADAIFEGLARNGFDAGSAWNYVTANLPNVFKPEDRQMFDTAASLWSQGLLRLESGAAISNQEKSWYERAFFTQPGDSLLVQAAKTDSRKKIEEAVALSATAGNISPEIKQRVRDIYSSKGAVMNLPTSGTPTGGTAFHTLTLDNGKIVTYDQNNRPVSVQQGAKPVGRFQPPRG